MLRAWHRPKARCTLDDWMARLFSPDRPRAGVVPWYVARAGRCIEQIWRVAVPLLELNTAVVLDIGLLSQSERESYYRRVDDAGFELSIHVLDASREVRRERVMARNDARGSTFSMHVPPEVFEFASDLWQPTGGDECDGRDVRFIRTDAARAGFVFPRPRSAGPARELASFEAAPGHARAGLGGRPRRRRAAPESASWGIKTWTSPCCWRMPLGLNRGSIRLAGRASAFWPSRQTGTRWVLR
jgi:hypothetical protein